MQSRARLTTAQPAWERRTDAAVHLVGIALATGGGAWLIGQGLTGDDDARLPCFAIYVSGMLMMFLASFGYNLLATRWRALLRRLDHAAIFLMIAGTYTPFAVLRLDGGLANPVGQVVWLGALAGAAAKLWVPARFERLAIPCYLLLGWMILWELGSLHASLAPPAFALLVAGGLLYTAGVPFCLMERLPFHNALWHGLVVAAAACHFASIAIEFA